MIPDRNKAREIAEAHCAAWTSQSAQAVAERYAQTTSFGMNGGDPMTTRAEIAEMAAGFMADFPGLVLTCDTVHVANYHMVYAWTFEGRHQANDRPVRFSGWEEWDLDENLKVVKSLGWYDVEDYEKQVGNTD